MASSFFFYCRNIGKDLFCIDIFTHYTYVKKCLGYFYGKRRRRQQFHSNYNCAHIISYTWCSLSTSSIYKFGLSVCLSVCLFVCLYPINDKTAEPIGPKFFVGPHGAPGKVYEWSKFQILVSIKIRSSLNFWKFWKSTKFFMKIRELFLFLFYDVHKENMFTINLEDGREAPSKASR